MKWYYILAKGAYWVSWPLSSIFLHGSPRVRVLVEAEGEILLQKGSFGSGRWSLPGGGIDRDESAKSAAVRELLEEAGIEIKASELQLLSTTPLAANRLGWPKMELTFFHVVLPSKPKTHISRPFEIKSLQWADKRNIPAQSSVVVTKALSLLL